MANKVLAHTPTLMQRGTMPYRIVLIEKQNQDGTTNEYVVWTETFKEDNPIAHDGYHGGDYFPVRGDKMTMFKKAHAQFNVRAFRISEYINQGNYNYIG